MRNETISDTPELDACCASIEGLREEIAGLRFELDTLRADVTDLRLQVESNTRDLTIGPLAAVEEREIRAGIEADVIDDYYRGLLTRVTRDAA